MVVFRINNLSLKGIIRAAGTEGFPRRGILRIRVAGLNHEFVDYTMEKHTVVIPFLYEFQEVVTVLGRVAEQAHLYVPLRGFKKHQCIATGGLRCRSSIFCLIHFS